MKLTDREKLIACGSKGLDGGDWVLLTLLVSCFAEVPTFFWVVVLGQYLLGSIYQLSLELGGEE